jgi:hypothetical protein
MKYFFLSLAGGFLLLFYGCRHYCCDVYHPNDIMYAERDSVLWNAVASGTIGANDSIKMVGVGQSIENLRDTLTLQLKYKGPGNYSLTRADASYHASIGNGPPFNSYKLDTLFSNSLVVTGYDQSTNDIQGSFSVKFFNPADPAGIRFLYGNFKVALNK